MLKIGFVINPIAGMGGKVGLKGTDGVLEEAVKRGAEPQAPGRAREALDRLAEAYKRHRLKEEVLWLCASGEMGEELIRSMEVENWHVEVVHEIGEKTHSEDTKSVVGKAVESGADLIVFCGGDGTARDVYETSEDVPIFGIPSGVKMHSGVFAVDPRTGGELLEFYIRGELTTGQGEIMDMDEQLYREGEWKIALYGEAKTLFEPSFVQSGKFMVQEESVEDLLEEIADTVTEMVEGNPDIVLVLGPGGTLKKIGESLGVDKTHLGVDVFADDSLVLKDGGDREIIKVLKEFGVGSSGGRKARIVVSPIGGQGFFLGRGNLQISPEMIRMVGIRNILVASVPQKLENTKVLRVDTGDRKLDERIRSLGTVKVLTGYRTYRVKKIN